LKNNLNLVFWEKIVKIKKEKTQNLKKPTFASPGLEQAADRAEAAAERQYT